MVSANQPRQHPAVCSPMAVSLVRATVIALVLTAVSATSVLAQIYVVTAADGTRRFTNEPVQGAQIFLQTHYSRDVATVSRGGSVPFQNEIIDAALREGIDAKLVQAVIAAESAFDPRALSRKGAQGLMQLMPDTADRFGVANPWDPQQNIAGGAAYLGWLIKEFNGDLPNVLAAYNAGEGAVTRHGGMPPFAETRHYVDRVLAYYRSLGGDSTMVSR